MSTAQYDRFSKSDSIPSLPKPRRSRFPSSISLPNGATHFHDACSSSPESEFKTISTPRPRVSRIRSEANDPSRELNMCCLGISNLRLRCCTFSSLLTVAKTFQLLIRASDVKRESKRTYLCAYHFADLNSCMTHSTTGRMY